MAHNKKKGRRICCCFLLLLLLIAAQKSIDNAMEAPVEAQMPESELPESELPEDEIIFAESEETIWNSMGLPAPGKITAEAFQNYLKRTFTDEECRRILAMALKRRPAAIEEILKVIPAIPELKEGQSYISDKEITSEEGYIQNYAWDSREERAVWTSITNSDGEEFLYSTIKKSYLNEGLTEMEELNTYPVEPLFPEFTRRLEYQTYDQNSNLIEGEIYYSKTTDPAINGLNAFQSYCFTYYVVYDNGDRLEISTQIESSNDGYLTCIPSDLLYFADGFRYESNASPESIEWYPNGRPRHFTYYGDDWVDEYYFNEDGTPDLSGV